MARSHGRILSSILLDSDFRTLSESAQRLYLILLAQPDLNTAGVMSLNYRRWARVCTSTSVDHIVKVAHELDDREYVLLDEETEEAFIRTLIRNDGIVKQPQMLKNALRTAEHVQSPRLRAALAAELRRLGRDDAMQTANQLDPGDLPEPPPPNPSNRSPIQAHRSLPAASPQPAVSVPAPCADPGGVGEGEGVISSSVRTSVSRRVAKRDADDQREDVKELCKHLRDRIVGNGTKPPTPGQVKAWTNSARLLIDRDERNLDEAHRLIDWCQDHRFWRSNVLGMPKFREQYDALRLQSQTDGDRPLRSAGGYQPFKNVASQDEYDESPFPRKEKTQ